MLPFGIRLSSSVVVVKAPYAYHIKGMYKAAGGHKPAAARALHIHLCIGEDGIRDGKAPANGI